MSGFDREPCPRLPRLPLLSEERLRRSGDPGLLFELCLLRERFFGLLRSCLRTSDPSLRSSSPLDFLEPELSSSLDNQRAAVLIGIPGPSAAPCDSRSGIPRRPRRTLTKGGYTATVPSIIIM